MTLEKLKSKNEADKNWLKTTVVRFRRDLLAKEDMKKSLQRKLDEQESLSAKIRSLEQASPVTLEKMGIAPAQAAKDVDALREKQAAVEAEVKSLEAKINELGISVSIDEKEIREFLNQFIREVEMRVRGEFAALLSTLIAPDNRDLLWAVDRGSLRELFQASFAARMIEHRRRRIDRIGVARDSIGELLAVCDSILADAIPSLVQNEPMKIGFSKSGHLELVR